MSFPVFPGRPVGSDVILQIRELAGEGVAFPVEGLELEFLLLGAFVGDWGGLAHILLVVSDRNPFFYNDSFFDLLHFGKVRLVTSTVIVVPYENIGFVKSFVGSFLDFFYFLDVKRASSPMIFVTYRMGICFR